jgi:hypothetical protein
MLTCRDVTLHKRAIEFQFKTTTKRKKTGGKYLDMVALAFGRDEAAGAQELQLVHLLLTHFDLLELSGLKALLQHRKKKQKNSGKNLVT